MPTVLINVWFAYREDMHSREQKNHCFIKTNSFVCLETFANKIYGEILFKGSSFFIKNEKKEYL
jgi:hypothetical protein